MSQARAIKANQQLSHIEIEELKRNISANNKDEDLGNESEVEEEENEGHNEAAQNINNTSNHWSLGDGAKGPY